MSSPFVPIVLFASMVLSMAAAVPLAEPAPAGSIGCVLLCALALGALAWWVVRADPDATADPHAYLVRTLDRFDERWPKFEQEFWAHVAARETHAELD